MQVTFSRVKLLQVRLGTAGCSLKVGIESYGIWFFEW